MTEREKLVHDGGLLAEQIMNYTDCVMDLLNREGIPTDKDDYFVMSSLVLSAQKLKDGADKLRRLARPIKAEGTLVCVNDYLYIGNTPVPFWAIIECSRIKKDGTTGPWEITLAGIRNGKAEIIGAPKSAKYICRYR